MCQEVGQRGSGEVGIGYDSCIMINDMTPAHSILQTQPQQQNAQYYRPALDTAAVNGMSQFDTRTAKRRDASAAEHSHNRESAGVTR